MQEQKYYLDHPQYLENLASILWGKSHYFDRDTCRFFRVRLCNATTIRLDDQPTPSIVLARTTKGAGWKPADGRVQEVVLLINGNAHRLYVGPSKRRAETVYCAFRVWVCDKLDNGETIEAINAKLKP